MPVHYEVTCINKPDRHNRHTHIENIGGVLFGTRWKFTEQYAIQLIETGQATFFVRVAGQAAQVVVYHHNGHKFLRTTADTVLFDNLLSLPECP